MALRVDKQVVQTFIEKAASYGHLHLVEGVLQGVVTVQLVDPALGGQHVLLRDSAWSGSRQAERMMLIQHLCLLSSILIAC